MTSTRKFRGATIPVSVLGILFVFLASALPVLPQSNDNCCNSPGWNCNSDEEWVDGYYAYQDHKCDKPQNNRSDSPGEPAITPTPTDAERLGMTQEEYDRGLAEIRTKLCPDTEYMIEIFQGDKHKIDELCGYKQINGESHQSSVSEQQNCCHALDWSCNSDEEWTDGYYAFQTHKCDKPQNKQTNGPGDPDAKPGDPDAKPGDPDAKPGDPNAMPTPTAGTPNNGSDNEAQKPKAGSDAERLGMTQEQYDRAREEIRTKICPDTDYVNLITQGDQAVINKLCG